MGDLLSNIQINSLIPILEGVSDAVFIDDNTGICIWCNSACEDFYMEARSNIQGKTVDQLVARGIFTQSVTKEVIEEKQERTLIHENKSGRRLLTSGYPLFDTSGNIQLIITTSRDITDLTNQDKECVDIIDNKMLDVRQINNIDYTDEGIMTASLAMQNVMILTRRLAAVESPVFITGESGVGKGLIAQIIHEESNRSDGPFIKVNCGAIPETLMEPELFGYIRGTYTGTRAEGKQGLIESANNGTLFLDEVSELPLNIQVKLLRLLNDHTITRVGSVNPITLNIRIVFASNVDLFKLVQEGKFRDDLYYSLNVAPITVPPLRDRVEDILPLIHKNLQHFNEVLHENKVLTEDSLRILLQYKWPGNVRELENIIERLVLTTTEDIISPDSLPAFLIEEAKTNTNINTDLSLQTAMERAEREVFENAISMYSSTREIARVLQVSQPTVVRKLNKYGLVTKSTTQNVEI